MRCFILRTVGDKNTFAIQYEFDVNPFNETSLIGETWGKFELSVRGIDICRYKRADSETTYQWNLIYIVEWFSENLKYILSEEPFPLPVEGQHSNRAGSFLPDVFFRRVNNNIEIAWNNESTYSSEGISFINPIGIEYVPLFIFESTIKGFIENFLDSLLENSKNKSDAEEVYQKLMAFIK